MPLHGKPPEVDRFSLPIEGCGKRQALQTTYFWAAIYLCRSTTAPTIIVISPLTK